MSLDSIINISKQTPNHPHSRHILKEKAEILFQPLKNTVHPKLLTQISIPLYSIFSDRKKEYHLEII